MWECVRRPIKNLGKTKSIVAATKTFKNEYVNFCIS